MSEANIGGDCEHGYPSGDRCPKCDKPEVSESELWRDLLPDEKPDEEHDRRLMISCGGAFPPEFLWQRRVTPAPSASAKIEETLDRVIARHTPATLPKKSEHPVGTVETQGYDKGEIRYVTPVPSAGMFKQPPSQAWVEKEAASETDIETIGPAPSASVEQIARDCKRRIQDLLLEHDNKLTASPHIVAAITEAIQSALAPVVAENDRLHKLVKVLQDWGCAGRQYTHVDNVAKLQAELEQAKEKSVRLGRLSNQLYTDLREHRPISAELMDFGLAQEVSAIIDQRDDLRTRLATAEAAFGECRKWIAGHAHLAGITANRKAQQILSAIDAAQSRGD